MAGPDQLLPPPELRRLVGDSESEAEFRAIGEGIAGMLRHYGLLRPGARLLDVGCGCGRVALALLDSEIGQYEGFDRNPELIRWAADHLSTVDRRFHFATVSVASAYDELDGHSGSVPAEAFAFPYDNESFDAVLLASLFTHMPMAGSLRYLSEVARVLRPGGRALGSWFIIDEAEEWKYGLAYFHSRARLTKHLDELGLAAVALNEGAGRNDRNRAPDAHEWYLLEKAE